MKKNRMMRAASALLVAVLLTTCTISGTFAKYVTSGEATDSARVAKFGVTVTATGETFVKEYTTDDGIYSGTIANSVVGVGSDVVAPGTNGTFATIAISGTPEVAVKVTNAATVTLNDKWQAISTAFYCPIIVTVKGTSYLKTINGLDYDSANAFATAIQEAVAGYTQVYAPGTDLTQKTTDGDSLVVTWAWPFENSTGSKINQSNPDDTLLGDRAAQAGNAATIALTITTTVEQID